MICCLFIHEYMSIIFLSITYIRLTSNLMNERPREAAEPTASRLHAAEPCVWACACRARPLDGGDEFTTLCWDWNRSYC
jgi:hypothetical protein